MGINIYDFTIPTMTLHLRNVSAELNKAQAHAEAKGISLESFAEGRLIEDMKPLTFQVQTASNTAKGLATRVANHANESWDDNETTFDQLQERIAKTIAYLDGVKREEFDDPAIETKEIPLFDRKFNGGLEYVTKYALPNFLFHVSMVYAILRSKGVQIGKVDYLMGGARPQDTPGASK